MRKILLIFCLLLSWESWGLTKVKLCGKETFRKHFTQIPDPIAEEFRNDTDIIKEEKHCLLGVLYHTSYFLVGHEDREELSNAKQTGKNKLIAWYACLKKRYQENDFNCTVEIKLANPAFCEKTMVEYDDQKNMGPLESLYQIYLDVVKGDDSARLWKAYIVESRRRIEESDQSRNTGE